MGCGACCLKCILILFNVIFGIIGFLFLAVGIVVKVGATKYIEPLLSSTFSSLTNLGSSLGVSDFDSSGSFDISKIGDILSPVAIVFIVFGAFLLLMCILGSIGLCCKVQVVLYVYAAIVLILFLAQLILVILFFIGTLDNTIKDQMLTTIKTKYIKTDSYDIYSLSWNLMHYKLECCGLNGYTDFSDATEWVRVRTVTILGVSTTVTLTTPLSCCKSTATDSNCAVTPIIATNYLNTGCWQKLRDATKAFEKIVIGVLAGILALQFICGVGAIIVGVQMKKDEEYA